MWCLWQMRKKRYVAQQAKQANMLVIVNLRKVYYCKSTGKLILELVLSSFFFPSHFFFLLVALSEVVVAQLPTATINCPVSTTNSK